MKKLFLLFFVLAGLSSAGQYSMTDFKALHLLEGRWEMKTRRGAVVEEWEKSNDSVLKGRTYLLVDGDTIPQETMELRLMNGRISYTPTVKNQNEGKPVSFVLRSITNGNFTFENKEHDFPQQIHYQPGEKTLRAAISGKTKDGEREIPYSYVRKG